MTYDCIKVDLWRMVHQTFLPFHESEDLVLFCSRHIFTEKNEL